MRLVLISFVLAIVASAASAQPQSSSEQRQPSPAFLQGAVDRQGWEEWFGRLSGEYRSGADYWAAHRSTPWAGSCYAPEGQNLGDWTAGCIAAQQRLSPSDIRRKTEPQYRDGWNSLPAPGISAALSPAQQQPTIGPSFDCSSARDVLARLICSDARLARLDLLFVQAYQALRQQVGEDGQAALRQQALDFQNGVYRICELPRTSSGISLISPTAFPCISRLYEQQRELWLSQLNGAAFQEAVRPLQDHIALQAALQQLGFLVATVRIDGAYRSTTRTAISSWQRSRGLPETGLLGSYDAGLLAQAQADRQAEHEAEVGRQREAEAQAAAEHEAQTRRQQDLEARERALAQITSKITDPQNTADLFIALGQKEGRIRRTLRGEFALSDTTRPARLCSISDPSAEPGFFRFALTRLLGNVQSGISLPAEICASDSLPGQDLVLVFRPAKSPADRSTVERLADLIGNSALERVGEVRLSEWEAAVEAERQAAKDEEQRQIQLASSVREHALDGTLASWAGVMLPHRAGTAACVIAAPSSAWIDIVRESLPNTLREQIHRVVADPDPEVQFASFLNEQCVLLFARGSDFGDVLRGLSANHREAIVLPMLVEPTQVEAGLATRGIPKTPPAASPTPQAPVPPPAPNAHKAATASILPATPQAVLKVIPAAVVATLTAEEVFDRSRNSIWIVVAGPSMDAILSGHGVALGSAVAVASNALLTNCHVIQDRPTIFILQGNHIDLAQLKAAEFSTDRCVLVPEQVDLIPIAGVRRFSDLRVGEHAFSIGAPSGLELTLGEGVISAKRSASGIDYVQTSAPVSPGSSGGGLFDTAGNLIGITTFIVRDAQNLNFAIAADAFWRP